MLAIGYCADILGFADEADRLVDRDPVAEVGRLRQDRLQRAGRKRRDRRTYGASPQKKLSTAEDDDGRRKREEDRAGPIVNMS